MALYLNQYRLPFVSSTSTDTIPLLREINLLYDEKNYLIRAAEPPLFLPKWMKIFTFLLKLQLGCGYPKPNPKSAIRRLIGRRKQSRIRVRVSGLIFDTFSWLGLGLG
jgi:hypothetical protein